MRTTAYLFIAALLLSCGSKEEKPESVRATAGVESNKAGKYGGWTIYQNKLTAKTWSALAFVEVVSGDNTYFVSQNGKNHMMDSNGFVQFTEYSPIRQDSIWVETDINDSVSIRTREPVPGTEPTFSRRTFTITLLEDGLRYAELSETFTADSLFRYHTVGSGLLTRAGD